MRVTRDFGHAELGSARTETVREDETVMRLLQSKFDVETRFGGRFVEAIDGLEGEGAGRHAGLVLLRQRRRGRASGPPSTSSRPGDRVQWDYRDWGAAMRVPAIVGAFPEPFLHGLEGKRRPVRVECEDAQSDACRDARATLEREGVPVSGSSLGAPGTETSRGWSWRAGRGARIVRGGADASRRARRRAACSPASRTTGARSSCSTSTATWPARCAPATAPALVAGAAAARRRARLARHRARREGLAAGVRALDEDGCATLSPWP